MEAVPEYNYHVEPNPEPEKMGKVEVYVTFVRPDNMESILTRSSFSCSLLAKEFTEDDNFPHKQQLHYFLTESGVNIQDAVLLILKLVRLAREVTSSVSYCPHYALLMWLTLDVVPLSERPTYIDDYRIEEIIQASVNDYEDLEEMIQDSLGEYEESFFSDSQIEEAIPASLNEYKFRPASKLKVKSLSRRTYKKKQESITIADQCTLYKSKRETSSTDDQCTICLENFDSEREVVTLPCGHEFDDKCIVEWLEVSHVCPLCRYEFPCEDDEIPQTPITKVF